jgi:hypothetical protein
MNQHNTEKKVSDRKLGDEWLDWDGKSGLESSEAGYKIFLGLATISIVFLVFAATLFLWLIYPRLIVTGEVVARIVSALFIAFSIILVFWLIFFVLSAAIRWPSTKLIIHPWMVNNILSVAMAIGKIIGISTDRLTNSFLKIHNMIVGRRPTITEPERLLVLAPRCLNKENNIRLRQLRDHYHFQMATADGGTEARLKIKEVRPKVIIAIACERDLISGFKEVNPYIPVIGFPNFRPEGPCKNTCVDLGQIEDAIKKCILPISE